MFCKKLFALFVWCHCYQIVLNPLLQVLLTLGIGHGSSQVSLLQQQSNDNHFWNHFPPICVSGSPITATADQYAFVPGKPIPLKCIIEDYPEAQFAWFRVRKYSNKLSHPPPPPIEEELKSTDDDKYTITNNALIIPKPTIADIADYYCKLKNPREDTETEKMIAVRAKPYIQDFNVASSTLFSAIVEEGKSLKIPCNVNDDYSPESQLKVTWQMSKIDENDMNDIVSGEEGITLIQTNNTSHTLLIDRVTKDHRRFYKCHVTNGIIDNSKVILIRVKDKYTVIWPTVGIVFELVILIGVICVVENRKVEPDKESNDRKAIQM